jgi:hypothetical protein
MTIQKFLFAYEFMRIMAVARVKLTHPRSVPPEKEQTEAFQCLSLPC